MRSYNRPAPSNPLYHYMIRYEMSRDLLKTERVVYGILDWLGDIGGFNEALGFLAFVVIYLTDF